MKFFLDNCMSPHHATGLRGFGELQKNTIQHLKEQFDEATPDVEWIGTLGREGDWIIVSGDLRITRNPAERSAWIESGLTAFFFGDAWSRKEYWKKAAELVHWWPAITREARAHSRGYGFLIPNGGKELKQIFPTTAK